jgi:hypothetical protein
MTWGSHGFWPRFGTMTLIDKKTSPRPTPFRRESIKTHPIALFSCFNHLPHPLPLTHHDTLVFVSFSDPSIPLRLRDPPVTSTVNLGDRTGRHTLDYVH